MGSASFAIAQSVSIKTSQQAENPFSLKPMTLQ
jgi:hypothetical protein